MAATPSAGRRVDRPARVRWRWTMAGSMAGMLLLAGLVPAAAVTHGGDPRERLSEVERQASLLERQGRELEADADEAERRLDVLGEQLDEVSARLQVARERQDVAVRLAEDAATKVQRTGAEVASAEQQLIEVEEQLGQLARRAYVHGRSSVEPMLAALAMAGTGDRLGDRLHFLERTVGAQAASVEAATSLTVQLAALRGRVRVEAEQADEALTAADTATAEVAQTHAEVLALTDDASRTLADQQAQLELIATERQELAAQADELDAKVEAEATARAAATRSSAGASSSGLATVRGITVAASLAPALESLLAAAAADGYVLGGSGYRSPEVTARLRIANGCPDVYNSPASSCRIPTARPGSSEHEKGLAVDFTWQAETICYPRPGARCSNNAAFDWLRANAARFGFHNLPSEAWHWSTTGR